MALSYRILCRSNIFFQIITKPVKYSVRKDPAKTLCNSAAIRYQNDILVKPLFVEKELRLLPKSFRQCSTQSSNDPTKPPYEPEKKGIIQKFKQMYKDYWYVLLPVHMTTSAIWFGGAYYCVRSGVDVVSLLESIGVSEKLVLPLRESSAGYFALALALYKVITPLRYAVTVGCTTYAIRRLTAIGWIKPVPSRERIKEMFQEKKDNIHDRFHESKQHYQTQIKEKGTQVMDEMRRYKSEMRNIKNKIKKM